METFSSKDDIRKAVGIFEQPRYKLYFAEMEKLFTPMPKPEPGDWLASQKEKPQPFDSYKLPYVNFVTPDKRTIYLQPYGKFNKEFMEKLVAFCEVFYPGTLVKILPEKDLLASIPNIRHRKNCYGEQYVCDDILAYMKTCVPKDAYCVMGITLHDIYPGPNWNYVYGWATYRARVGIFSFLRWDEYFASGNTPYINWQEILYPSIRTMVHEIGHMFAVLHCVYYRCLMNGYNNIEENYKNPLYFCPVCFRKILSNLQFDRQSRYEKLIAICQKLGDYMLWKDIPLYESLLKITNKFGGELQPKQVPATTKPTNARQQSLKKEIIPPPKATKPTVVVMPKKPVQRGVSVPIRRN